MKLYVNGDSHAAAAEAVNPHAFAEDDNRYFYMGRAPHPDNAAVCWSRRLSEVLKSSLHLEAEAASSNDRIIRTTRTWLEDNRRSWGETLVILQWSTWERQEWQDQDGRWYQVNASGIDVVPEQWQDRYRRFIIDIDWDQCTQQAHDKIWQFHQELAAQKIRHFFFNGNSDFSKITQQQDWGSGYIGPYDPGSTYNEWLKSNGYHTVHPKSWHFGADAHSAWAKFMLQYIMKNQLMV